jgi:tetratricopeptide (TPR) repeat protein
MRSQISFLITSILLVSTAVFVMAQEPETLGDVAKRLREEKAAQANSSQLNEPESAPAGMVSENDKSQLSSGPLSQLQIFAWIAGGLTGQDLVREVKARGLSFEADETYIRQLAALGGASALAADLRSTKQHFDTPIVVNADAVEQMFETATSVENKDFATALRQIKPLVQRNPKNLNLLFALGNILNKLEYSDGAAGIAAHLVEVAPDFPHAHEQLAFAYYKMEIGPQAVAEARALVQLRPDSSDGHKF